MAAIRTEMKEIQNAMRLSLEYDVEEFNDAKRNRYISAITSAISSETKVHDLTSIGFYDNPDSNWKYFGFSSFSVTDGSHSGDHSENR